MTGLIVHAPGEQAACQPREGLERFRRALELCTNWTASHTSRWCAIRVSNAISASRAVTGSYSVAARTREGCHARELSLRRGELGRRGSAAFALPLSLLALPQAARRGVRDLRDGARVRVPHAGRGARLALGVVARLLPPLLPPLRLRRARRARSGHRLRAGRKLRRRSRPAAAASHLRGVEGAVVRDPRRAAALRRLPARHRRRGAARPASRAHRQRRARQLRVRRRRLRVRGRARSCVGTATAAAVARAAPPRTPRTWA